MLRGAARRAGRERMLSPQHLLPKTFPRPPWPSRVCSVNCFGTARRLRRNAPPHGRVHIRRGFCPVRAEPSLCLGCFCPESPAARHPFTAPLRIGFGGALWLTHAQEQLRHAPPPHFSPFPGTTPRGVSGGTPKSRSGYAYSKQILQQLHKSRGAGAKAKGPLRSDPAPSPHV